MAELFNLLVVIILGGLVGLAAAVVVALLYGCVLGIIRAVKKEAGKRGTD